VCALSTGIMPLWGKDKILCKFRITIK